MKRLTRSAYAEPASSLAFKTGSWRVQKPVHRHAAAPCHAICPAGEDAQAYLARVEEGDLRGAWERLVTANPLPAITGRVCHHPCEGACNRGGYDSPIAIHEVERYLGDEAIRHGWAYPVATPAGDAPEVAIVGAGPAGLACAWHLVRAGLRAVVFDALPVAGGTCRTAIPPYRLPRAVLDAETERLLALPGLRFERQKALGRQLSLRELEQEFPALFLAPGTQRSREWSIDGVTPRDLHAGLDLLKEWVAIGSAPEARSAAVVGGGNTAIDLARCLKRSGVGEVHVITDKALPGPGVTAAEAMPAIAREIGFALEEGVLIHPHRGIHRLILRGERVIGVELVHQKKLPGADGRRRVAFEGTETVLKVDQVIPAIGQVVAQRGLETLLGNRNFLRADDWGALSKQPGIWVGGDARGDRGSVTEAVGDGRRAALAIAARLRGAEPVDEARGAPLGLERINLHYFEPRARAEAPLLALGERGEHDEVEGGLDARQVRSEAERCFSCGNCFACDNCWTFCPDESVLKTREVASDGTHYLFDYDYCKGCGLCAKECPCGFIEMVPEI